MVSYKLGYLYEQYTLFFEESKAIHLLTLQLYSKPNLTVIINTLTHL